MQVQKLIRINAFPKGKYHERTNWKSVPVVTLNTSAFDVDLIIQPTNAIFPSNKQIPPKLCRDRNPQQSPQVTQPLPPSLSRPLAKPIKIDKLQAYLEDCSHRSWQYLIESFRFGFSIDCVGHHSNFVSKNLLSATTNPKVVDEKLAKEIQLGRIVGPFDRQPFPVFHVSPLGLIPKKVPGEFSLIHHLSFPEGNSINSHIP